METILVTGGAGFIGSNFIRYTQNKFPDVKIVNIDLLTYAGNEANLENLPSPHMHLFIHDDICNQIVVESLLRENKITKIIHFAAETHVDRSLKEPKVFLKSNVYGTFHLLEAAKKVWLDEGLNQTNDVRFHHISTDEVYGSLSKQDPAFTEDTPYSPNSPYAASKASSDHLVRSYYKSFGLPVTISNCSNNYGPYQFPEKLIPFTIFNALMDKPIPIYGDGQQIRDWLYVEDHCEAMWHVILNGTVGESYNIGGDNQPANLDIVRSICDIIDIKTNRPTPCSSLITHINDRPGHDRRYAMNIQKIKTHLGWEPKNNIQTGLEKTVEWYLGNQTWLLNIAQNAEFKKWVKKNYQMRGSK